MGRKARHPSQWAGVQSRTGARPPISPEGAITTGQQVVEDIERGLAGWASGHTQLLQEHRLRHSVNEEGSHSAYASAGGARPWSSKPQKHHQSSLFPTTSLQDQKTRARLKGKVPDSWNEG